MHGRNRFILFHIQILSLFLNIGAQHKNVGIMSLVVYAIVRYADCSATAFGFIFICRRFYANWAIFQYNLHVPLLYATQLTYGRLFVLCTIVHTRKKKEKNNVNDRHLHSHTHFYCTQFCVFRCARVDVCVRQTHFLHPEKLKWTKRNHTHDMNTPDEWKMCTAGANTCSFLFSMDWHILHSFIYSYVAYHNTNSTQKRTHIIAAFDCCKLIY